MSWWSISFTGLMDIDESRFQSQLELLLKRTFKLGHGTI